MFDATNAPLLGRGANNAVFVGRFGLCAQRLTPEKKALAVVMGRKKYSCLPKGFVRDGILWEEILVPLPRNVKGWIAWEYDRFLKEVGRPTAKSVLSHDGLALAAITEQLENRHEIAAAVREVAAELCAMGRGYALLDLGAWNYMLRESDGTVVMIDPFYIDR